MGKKKSFIKGFTLVELIISMTILSMIVVFISSIYSNFFDSFNRLQASNLVYEEARFLLDRIAKEVRSGTIDYEEYYNQNLMRLSLPDSYDYLRNETYADSYCQYSRQFYNVGADGEIGTLDDQSTGERASVDPVNGLTAIPPAIGFLDSLGASVASPIQEDLYLTSVNGASRTYFKKIIRTDSKGNQLGQLALLKLEGHDFGTDGLNAFDPMLDGSSPGLTCQPDLGENDGRIDTWLCEDGFPCEVAVETNADLCEGVIHNIVHDPSSPENSSFVPISPKSLDIVDLKFIVSPMDDPYKAYNNDAVQIQPHVTVRLTAKASPFLAQKFGGTYNPTLVVESTISARTYDEIASECNVKQCTPSVSPDRACPLSTGVCGPAAPGSAPAQQSCQNYIWPGCGAATYETYADATYGLDNLFPGGNRTFFENGLEYRSCESELSNCLTLCLGNQGCEDACQTTANACKNRRCSDSIDNDCSGTEDSADNACQIFFCNDGLYADGIEEVTGCIDVGGLCQSIRPQQTEETSCNDGHDNDCDGFADQFDADCVTQLCSNGSLDPGGDSALYLDSVVPLFLDESSVNSPNYLLDETPSTAASLNEQTVDIGGICALCFDSATGEGSCACGSSGCTNRLIMENQEITAGESGALCYDHLDNDNDGRADELDSDCQPTLCQDRKRNCDLAPNSYTPADYLGGYNDQSCIAPPLNLNDEACVDVGGVCDGFTDTSGANHTFLAGGEASASSCNDQIDNDCDGTIDWAEPDGSCCSFANYCLKDSASTFTDTFSSADYLSPLSPLVTHDAGAGILTLTSAESASVIAMSKPLPLDTSECSGYQLSLQDTLVSTPGSSQITFQLSGDNGDTWCGDDNCSGDIITIDELTQSVSVSGDFIRWRATLSGDNPNNPQINEVSVSISSCT